MTPSLRRTFSEFAFTGGPRLPKDRTAQGSYWPVRIASIWA